MSGARSPESNPVLQFVIPVLPAGIALIDQVDLPVAFPLLPAAFAGDRVPGEIELLEIDECEHLVFLTKDRAFAIPMLPDPAGNVARRADIERAIGLRRQNIGIGRHAIISCYSMLLVNPFADVE